ncbi:Ribosome production factor 2-like protein [Larimichthys crocea]|uniref:Uncharacterized protein n=1 Tax=Larimichthys crocea TaxID=215358 RepID=A0ACD3R0Z1_LARCR|nr:Ribosome production factor 2-like protein [Larimichthys crocea]
MDTDSTDLISVQSRATSSFQWNVHAVSEVHFKSETTLVQPPVSQISQTQEGSMKSRPPSLLYITSTGRLFDFHVLDMIELGIDKFVSLSDIKVSKCPEGTKPMLVFAGEAFDTDNEHKRLKSLLTGRLFDFHVLDMIELGIDKFVSLSDIKPKKKKNISHDAFGTKFGRVHMQKQDLSKLQTRKMKGLRKRGGEVVSEDQDGQTSKVAKVES